MRAGLAIVNLEARRDENGHIRLYELPANDGGGRWEMAGINSRYHPEALERLRKLDPADREEAAAQYIEDWCLKGTGLRDISLSPGVRFYVLDSTFNRGPGGSAWMAQQACKRMSIPVQVDGLWGPKTREALELADERNSAKLLSALREKRELYEREKVGVRTNLWRGLVSRWDKALVISRKWNEEEAQP